MAATSSSSSDPCSICLEPVKKEEAYLDQCFHSFCHHCITHWSRFVSHKQAQPLSSIKCPICKTENFSIVHGFNGEFFLRDYVNPERRKSFLSGAHEFRFQRYYNEAATRNNKFDIQQYWKRRKYLKKNIWLQTWLTREIQALIQEEDVDLIVHHILGVVQSFLVRQERECVGSKPERMRREFRTMLSDAAGRFLLAQTERFVDEMELFLVSGLNIEAYDKICMRFLRKPAPGSTGEHDGEPCDLQDPYLTFLREDLDQLD